MKRDYRSRAMTRTLLLPWPPTLNNYRVPVSFGGKTRLITSPEGRRYVRQATSVIREQSPGKPMTGRLSVSVMMHCEANRRYDLDNFLKALLDSCTEAGVWGDDSQIDRIEVRRGEKRGGGECLVVIEELSAVESLPTE